MTNFVTRLAMGVMLLGGAGCLDLSEEGKVFAGDDAGVGGGAGGGGGTVECSCQLPEAACQGAVRISAAASRCQADGGCDFQLIETACPNGCAAGACIGEPCLGMVCNQAPAARCQSTTALRVFTSPGACQAGGCLYASADVSCDCLNDRCTQNPCIGVTCNQPPGTTCVGASLRTYQSPGTCDATTGRCAYALADTACGIGGCNAGQCSNDKCAGVVCNQPPAATCLSTTSVQVSMTPGTCSVTSGACSYATQTVTCGAGKQCSQGACIEVSASCNASNCAGCCNGNTCVLLAAQSNTQCGGAGAACGSCGGGAPVCESGTCVSKCAGISCTQPPAAVCFDATTVTQWSGGTCNPATGACSYSSANVTCGAGNTCAAGACSCVSESAGALCARLAKTCGAVSSNDNCGVPRTVNCGSCSLPQTCNASLCSCMPEPNATFCSRLGKNCGSVSAIDNCGAARTAACGSCTSPATCGATNVCACVAETNTAFCNAYSATCGTVPGVDNCGTPRTVTCGSCNSPQTCNGSNTCSCVAESNSTFCSRLGKNCGSVTAADNCGATRTVTSCGGCASPQTCGGGGATNVCGGTASTKLNFSTSWQTIPNTGSQTVEFMCAGTVSTTTLGGTKCSLSAGDPVRIRIDGSVYQLYPGCDGGRPSNCMTSITPTGATYASYGLYSAARLLCDAMGWPFSKGVSDNNPGTVDRAVAVVQTAPSVIGTDSGLKNYSTYFTCEP